MSGHVKVIAYVNDTIVVAGFVSGHAMVFAYVIDTIDGAGFVSGHVMVVDGGAWMWRKPLLPRAQVRFPACLTAV